LFVIWIYFGMILTSSVYVVVGLGNTYSTWVNVSFLFVILNIFWFDTYFICLCCCWFVLSIYRKWVNDSFLFCNLNIFWFDTYLICFCCCCFELSTYREWVNVSFLFVIWIYFGLILTWSVFVVVALNCPHTGCELMIYFFVIWIYFGMILTWSVFVVVTLNCAHTESELIIHFICNFWMSFGMILTWSVFIVCLKKAALHIACNSGNVDIVKLLIQAGAAINLKAVSHELIYPFFWYCGWYLLDLFWLLLLWIVHIQRVS